MPAFVVRPPPPLDLRGAVGPLAHLQVGAYMNETFQARDGLSPHLFPSHLPTYTGHYHRRHTVKGTNIHYVGSPYQVKPFKAPPPYLPYNTGEKLFCGAFTPWPFPFARL